MGVKVLANLLLPGFKVPVAKVKESESMSVLFFPVNGLKFASYPAFYGRTLDSDCFRSWPGRPAISPASDGGLSDCWVYSTGRWSGRRRGLNDDRRYGCHFVAVQHWA